MNETVNDTVTQGTQKIQEGIEMAQKFGELVVEYLVKYGFQVLGGIIILFIGFKLANWAARLFTNFGVKKHYDITLTKFIANIIRGVILVFVVLMALEKFGVTINPLIAAASAMIFGASFALQAPLSNYAAGLTVILTRPFKVGDTVKVQDVKGIVEEVKLPCTMLVTEDGDRIAVPNKEIVGQIVWNSAENSVVERSIGISYHDDPQKTVDVIRACLKEHAKVRQTPVAQIGIESFGDSAINIGMRYWVPTKEYYEVMYEVNLAVYASIRQAGITIPFPQREVRMISK